MWFLITSLCREVVGLKNKDRIRPLTPTEKQFATDNYHLITKFLKLSKLDAEEYFDVLVMDFLLAVENYLSNEQIQSKCNFEAFSYILMRRAINHHFRDMKAQKRSSEAGADVSLERIDDYIGKAISMENLSALEYMETVEQIESNLTEEQWKIFADKLEGYNLKEIAQNNGIKPKRVYKQFRRIKRVVADVMEIQQ